MSEPTADTLEDGGSADAATGSTASGSVTQAQGTPPPYRDLPPVTERELAARARGLASAYIDGGDDPDIEETHRRERKYMRLLIGMVAIIVGGGLLVTIVGIATMGNGQ